MDINNLKYTLIQSDLIPTTDGIYVFPATMTVSNDHEDIFPIPADTATKVAVKIDCGVEGAVSVRVWVKDGKYDFNAIEEVFFKGDELDSFGRAINTLVEAGSSMMSYDTCTCTIAFARNV